MVNLYLSYETEEKIRPFEKKSHIHKCGLRNAEIYQTNLVHSRH